MANELQETIGLGVYIDKLKDLKRTVGGSLFAIGALLKEVRDKKLYEEQYDSFNEFLGDPELSFRRSTAYKAITVYEVYQSSKLDISGIDHDKLYLLAENVRKEPDKIKEFIADAKYLSRSDLRKKYGKQVKKPDLDARIEQFIKDFYNVDRRKGFIKTVIQEWEGQ